MENAGEIRIQSMVGTIFRFFEQTEHKLPLKRERTNSIRSALRSKMVSLQPGEVAKIATNKHRDAASLQSSSWSIAINDLELPAGSFRTRITQSEDTDDEWIFYIQRQ